MASATIATACLRALFAPPTIPDPYTGPSHNAPGPAAAADTCLPSNEARSKRARRSESPAVAKQHLKDEDLGEEWTGKGATAPFLGRLMAVEALSELMHVVDYHRTSSAAESGAPPHAHGADGRDNTAMVTARELILKEAARRAGSPWAWEREIAFLIVEAFAKRVGHKRADDRPPSLRYDRNPRVSLCCGQKDGNEG